LVKGGLKRDGIELEDSNVVENAPARVDYVIDMNLVSNAPGNPTVPRGETVGWTHATEQARSSTGE
jgi:hypothetical protein